MALAVITWKESTFSNTEQAQSQGHSHPVEAALGSTLYKQESQLWAVLACVLSAQAFGCVSASSSLARQSPAKDAVLPAVCLEGHICFCTEVSHPQWSPSMYLLSQDLCIIVASLAWPGQLQGILGTIYLSWETFKTKQ